MEDKRTPRTQLFMALSDAMYRFIQKHPPNGFNVPLFQILTQADRLEEAVKYLDEFEPVKADAVEEEVAAALAEVLELFEWSNSGGPEEAAYDRGIAALQRRNAKKEVRDGS